MLMLMLVDQYYSMDEDYGPRPDPRTRLWQDTEAELESPRVWNSSNDHLAKTKVRVNMSNSDDLGGGEVAVSSSGLMYLMSIRRAGRPLYFLISPGGGQRGSTESGDGKFLVAGSSCARVVIY